MRKKNTGTKRGNSHTICDYMDLRTSLKRKIPLKEGKEVAEELKSYFLEHTFKVEIVGSIRREKEFVNDIDFVVIAKPYFLNSLFKLNIKMQKAGSKIISFNYKGIGIDIYLANEDTFETLKLIRTGSAGHNIKLCSIAKEKGMHLYASGEGLWKDDVKIADTEEEILKTLLGTYKEPKEREI